MGLFPDVNICHVSWLADAPSSVCSVGAVQWVKLCVKKKKLLTTLVGWKSKLWILDLTGRLLFWWFKVVEINNTVKKNVYLLGLVGKQVFIWHSPRDLLPGNSPPGSNRFGAPWRTGPAVLPLHTLTASCSSSSSSCWRYIQTSADKMTHHAVLYLLYLFGFFHKGEKNMIHVTFNLFLKRVCCSCVIMWRFGRLKSHVTATALVNTALCRSSLTKIRHIKYDCYCYAWISKHIIIS